VADETKQLTKITASFSPPGTMVPHLEQRDALIQSTKMMAEQARAQQSVEKRSLYAIAATLCAHAAAEGILNEWLLRSDRTLYRQLVVRNKTGLVPLAKQLLAMIGGKVPIDLSDLSTHKSALTHPRPEHERTRVVGAWLVGDGAQRALAVVLDLEQQFFSGGQPKPIR
jgi:hypothetical protein